MARWQNSCPKKRRHLNTDAGFADWTEPPPPKKKTTNAERCRESKKKMRSDPERLHKYLENARQYSKRYRACLDEEQKARQTEQAKLRMREMRKRKRAMQVAPAQKVIWAVLPTSNKKIMLSPGVEKTLEEKRACWRAEYQKKKAKRTPEEQAAINEKRRRQYAEKKAGNGMSQNKQACHNDQSTRPLPSSDTVTSSLSADTEQSADLELLPLLSAHIGQLSTHLEQPSADKEQSLLSADVGWPLLSTHTGQLSTHEGQLSVNEGQPLLSAHKRQLPGHTGQLSTCKGQLSTHTDQSSLSAHRGQPSVHTGQLSVHTGQPSVHTGQPSVHTGQLPVHTGQLSACTGHLSAHTAQLSVNIGLSPHTTQLIADTGQLSPYTGQLPVHTGQLSPHTGQLSPHTGQLSPHTGQLSVHAGQLPAHTGQLSVHTGQLPAHTGQLSAHKRQLSCHTGQPQTRQLSTHKGQVTVHAGQLSAHTRQSSLAGHTRQLSAQLRQLSVHTEQPPQVEALQEARSTQPQTPKKFVEMVMDLHVKASLRKKTFQKAEESKSGKPAPTLDSGVTGLQMRTISLTMNKNKAVVTPQPSRLATWRIEKAVKSSSSCLPAHKQRAGAHCLIQDNREPVTREKVSPRQQTLESEVVQFLESLASARTLQRNGVPVSHIGLENRS